MYFATVDARAAARVALRCDEPAHAAQWSDPQLDAEYEEVRSLVLKLSHAATRRSCVDEGIRPKLR